MKKIFICTGLVLLSVVLGFGQKQKRQPDVADGPNNGKSSANRSIVLDSGMRIDGELQSTIDVKKSKVGDEVVLKTTKSIKQNGQTILPKGAKLIGRITELQQKTKANGGSKLGVVFDRIEGKDMATPVTASIVSIIASNVHVGDTANADVFGSSSTSTTASGGSAGGGLVGKTLGGVTNTAGGALGSTTQALGSVVGTSGQVAGTTTSSLAGAVNGIQISNSVEGSAQSGTTLSALNKNIKLEKGVTFSLQLNGLLRTQ